MNGFDDSPVTFDVRAADHFRHTAENYDVRFAVRDCLIHFCFPISAFASGSRTSIDVERPYQQSRVSYRFPATLRRPGTPDANC